jgi:alpha-tubulin suppressor-like RCC1 family protein
MKEDEILEVRCGHSHSMAISMKGRVFSWGEGVTGKLGLGFSKTLKSSQN